MRRNTVRIHITYSIKDFDIVQTNGGGALVVSLEAGPVGALYLELLTELQTFLASSNPNAEEICSFLVLRTFRFWNGERAFISFLEHDGTFRRFDYFGLSDEAMRELGEIKLTDNTPMAEAVRTVDVVVAGQEDIGTKWKKESLLPHEWSNRTLVDVPMIINGIPRGVIGLVLATRVEESKEFLAFVKSASSAVVLHCVNALGLKPARIRSRGFELTDRQRKILHLMTQGLTNSAIASKLGFSESLIRQETVKIYRELEVANRQEAGKIYQEMAEAERDKA